MNVTRKNFNQLLPEIREQIKAADFVALDLEFTGLPDDKARVNDQIWNFFISSQELKFDWQRITWYIFIVSVSKNDTVVC